MTLRALQLILLCLATTPVFATYPARPVTLIMPYPATGPFEIAGTVKTNKVLKLLQSYGAPSLTDVIAAHLQRTLPDTLGQPVIVERRARMHALEGARRVADAAPDGYTMLLSDSSEVLRHRCLYGNAGRGLEQALTPVAMFARMPFVLVSRPTFPARSALDLVRIARGGRGQLALGSADESSIGWLAGERFAAIAGISVLHVPFNGGTAAANGIIRNQIDAAFVALPVVLPLLAGGRLRLLGIADLERHPSLPWVPTMREAGIGNLEVAGWYGVFAPGKTRAPVLDRMGASIAAATRLEDTRTLLLGQGLRPSYLPYPQFRTAVRAVALEHIASLVPSPMMCGPAVL